ncbi:MAG TPA: acyl-CoA dehydrogenase C-terminal domain-containing protein, partial [Magnetospirillum sp.]|nr:acyl-CoA dehydrogenase C-terminal domain-containing protein [Magnetospirillum sp.]
AAAVPLLKLMGVVLGGFQMARAARVARAKLDARDGDLGFFDAKLKTAWFYAEHILPQAPGLLASITRGAATVMTLSADQL